jgi:phenylpropionate dioxygenase-like ring-hydroxylating dioxygenase large terminal subunit
MFIYNNWYIAAVSREVEKDQLLARTILNEAVVLYRRTDGSIAALEDRCCHRLAPLSLGEVVGDTLRCGYHGFRFDGAGRCVEIPGQDKIPGKAQVRSFPVTERHGFVWIWMGDPMLAGDESTIPGALDVLDVEGWDARTSYVLIKAGYRLIVDNLHDGSHAEFVHRRTLSVEGMGETMRQQARNVERSYQFELVDGGIQHRWKVLNAPGGPAFVKGLCMTQGLEYETHKGDPVNWTLETRWYPPCIWTFKPTTYFVGENPQEGSVWVNIIAITPETETTTHYFWGDAQDFAPGEPKFADFYHEATAAAFAEDVVVFESQQRNIGHHDVSDFPLVTVVGDAASVQARRIIEALKAKESTYVPGANQKMTNETPRT